MFCPFCGEPNTVVNNMRECLFPSRAVLVDILYAYVCQELERSGGDEREVYRSFVKFIEKVNKSANRRKRL